MGGKKGGGGDGSSKKPKGPVSAYLFFVKISRDQWEQQGSEPLSFGDHSKKCAELWKEMSASQRMPYVQLQMQDNSRYQKEMRSYIPPPGTAAVKVGKAKRMRKAKDPKAPKRGLSAFFWFSHDERAKVKAANPGFGVAEVAKVLGRMWGGMNDAAKSQYQTMAAQDKARYQKEMEEYKKLAASRDAAAAQMEEDDDDDEDEEEEQESEDGDEEMS